MLNGMRNKDIRTLGYVLRRTNYGEADRILSIITPVGKISAVAKGVRKEKSKLAGGIEMFTLGDFNVHIGKGELGVVTGAKMVRHCSGIVKDLSKMELAAMVLKKVGIAAEHSDSVEFFEIVNQALMAINMDNDLQMIEAWCLLNIKKVIGEEINLYRDSNGEKLLVDKKYNWDAREMVFVESERGEFGASDIKLMRLMVSNNFGVMQRVKVEKEMVQRILQLARMVV